MQGNIYEVMKVEIKIPSDKALQNIIKMHYKDVKSIMLCKKSSINKVFENGVWKYYYQRDFKLTLKKSKPLAVTIRLIQVGDKFVLNKFFVK